jgi:ribosome maturation factor RimP
MKKENKNKNKQPAAKTQSKKLIEQTVKNLVESEIINLGYEIWDIEYYNDGIEWLLEITIDKPESGISLDDCEKVTRAVNPIIDEADPIENSYSLAVSSPGLNRELKNAFHLNKYINKEITVKLFAKNEIVGNKAFNAILKEFSDENYKFEIVGRDAINEFRSFHAPFESQTPFVLTKKEVAHIYAYDEINI